jgi:Putative addiction module component
MAGIVLLFREASPILDLRPPQKRKHMTKLVTVPPPGFDELTVDEQIDYVQSLWERIAATTDEVPVPDWHREVLDERLKDLNKPRRR